jgi:DNA repair exonuclease SbcCD ATPase subunit
MSTPPSNENSTSDFLQLEPIGVQGASGQPSGAPDGENWDVDKELSSLFELMGSHSQQVERAAKAKQSDALQQESQQLIASIAETKNQLAQIQQSSQEKISAIEQGFTQAEQLQQRTEQLAKYSKVQVRQLQEMLQSFDAVRHEIVTALDRFGSYERIEPLVQQIQGAEQSLNQAEERLHTHQASLYQSLQSIQQQVEQRGTSVEQNLTQKQGELKKLLMAIREDRDRVAAIEESIGVRLAQSDLIHQDLSKLQKGLEEKSTVVHNNLTDLNSNFASLSESVQHEKQQFYQLTAEMINKTDAMRSQFAEIAKQVSKDWESIQSMQFRVDDLCDRFDTDNQQQVNQLVQRQDEMVASWGDVKKKQQTIDRFQRSQKTWLRLLSVGFGGTFLAVIVLIIKVFLR